jgi:segregation and condensation protein A
MTERDYEIKTKVFEGPLELLLDLIEKRKLFINDISLAEVTDDYISQVYERNDFPVSQASAFLVTASTLLLIKSRSLLPYFEVSDAEEQDMEDLESRLKLYKRIRDLSNHVREKMFSNMMYTRTQSRYIDAIFAPDKEISVQNLRKTTENLLTHIPKMSRIPEAVVKKIVSLDEKIRELTDRISQQMSLTFSEFTGMGKEKKTDVIVSFLALLELAKQGLVSISQDSHQADINISAKSQN